MGVDPSWRFSQGWHTILYSGRRGANRETHESLQGLQVQASCDLDNGTQLPPRDQCHVLLRWLPVVNACTISLPTSPLPVFGVFVWVFWEASIFHGWGIFAPRMRYCDACVHSRLLLLLLLVVVVVVQVVSSQLQPTDRPTNG